MSRTAKGLAADGSLFRKLGAHVDIYSSNLLSTLVGGFLVITSSFIVNWLQNYNKLKYEVNHNLIKAYSSAELLVNETNILIKKFKPMATFEDRKCHDPEGLYYVDESETLLGKKKEIGKLYDRNEYDQISEIKLICILVQKYQCLQLKFTRQLLVLTRTLFHA